MLRPSFISSPWHWGFQGRLAQTEPWRSVPGSVPIPRAVRPINSNPNPQDMSLLTWSSHGSLASVSVSGILSLTSPGIERKSQQIVY